MSAVEKFFVNRRAKGASNVAVVERQLAAISTQDIRHALELGCGIGDVSAALAKRFGLHATGVDVDPSQIARARTRFGEESRLRFAEGDACQLEFAADRFDLVVAQNVFHHLPCWRRAAAEVARVLRPGGYLFWLDLTPPAFLKSLLERLSDQYGVYTLSEVRTAFRDAGLIEVANRQTLRMIPIRHELILRKPPDTLDR